MHFFIAAAFGGRLATLLKLAHQSQQLAAETGHTPLLVAIFFSSSAKGLAASKARERLHKLADCALRPGHPRLATQTHAAPNWQASAKVPVWRAPLSPGAAPENP